MPQGEFGRRGALVIFGLWMVPVATLSVAFAAICISTGTWAPWDRVVHEDGHRTLLQTIFYFEHTVRELPLDAMLALAAASAFAFHFPPTPAGRAGRRSAVAELALTLVLLAMVVGALRDVGLAVTLDNLLQKPVREGVEAWGAHWRYHFVSSLSSVFLVFALASGLAALRGYRGVEGDRKPTAFGLTLALFGALTVVFVPNLDPLMDPQYLGHQARELFTHTLVTIPLTVAALGSVAFPTVTPPPGRFTWAMHRLGYTAAAVSFAGCLYLMIGVVLTDAASRAQSASLASTVGAHFFEHTFSYMVVPLLALVAYPLLRDRSDDPSGQGPPPTSERRSKE